MYLRNAQSRLEKLLRRSDSMSKPLNMSKQPLRSQTTPDFESGVGMTTAGGLLEKSSDVRQPCLQATRGTAEMPLIPNNNKLSTESSTLIPATTMDDSICESENQKSESNGGGSSAPIHQVRAALPHLRVGPGPGEINTASETRSPKICTETLQTEIDACSSHDWTKIRRLRAEIWSKRSFLQECRRVLRDKERLKAIADDRYIQFLRLYGHGVRFGHQSYCDEQMEVNTLFQACEAARQEYGPIDHNCSVLENDLSVLEFNLDRLEKRFYDQSSQQRPSLMANYDSTRHSLKVPSISSSDSGSEKDQYRHPLLSEYLSKLGDVEIYRERLDELLEERYILEEDREKRARVGLRLSEENEQWLADYSQVEAELIEQFESARKGAEKLKQQCLLLNLVDKDGEPTDQEYQETHAFVKDLNDVGAGEVSEYVKHPTLLPSPGAKLPMEVPSSILLGDDVVHISPVRVNSWILEQVRRSALEVELLARTHDTQHDRISSREEWQSDVLQIWYKDRALDDWLSARPSSPIRTMAPLSTGCPSSTSAEDSPIGIWNQASQVLLPEKFISEDGSVNSRQSGPVLHAPCPIQLVDEE